MEKLKIQLKTHDDFKKAWARLLEMGYQWGCAAPCTAIYLYAYEDGFVYPEHDISDIDLSSCDSNKEKLSLIAKKYNDPTWRKDIEHKYQQAEIAFKQCDHKEVVLNELLTMPIHPKTFEVGQKIKLDASWWIVRAVRHPFVICTQNMFGKSYYTIIDMENKIRGTGTSWGFGHCTDKEIAESMLALHGEDPNGYEQEISRRNRVDLVITAIKPQKSLNRLDTFIERMTPKAVQSILNDAHPEAVWYVDGYTSNFGGIHGYYVDKFVLGVDNRSDFYKLSELKEALLRF